MSEIETRGGVLKTAFHDAMRMREIATVLSKHGLQEATRALGLDSYIADNRAQDALDLTRADQRSLAARARRVLEDLGPTFIKLGQILSTRPDILPPPFIQEFEKLQDSAPSIPFSEVRQLVETELGGTLDELFGSFHEEELATASMAQVHRATLKSDGREVVVKVQRPGIDQTIRSDLALLYYLARFGEATVDEVGLYNPVAIIKEFEKAITQELNFLIEADNNEFARENAQNLESVVIPEVIPNLTTGRVITQTYIDGDKLGTIESGSERGKKLAHIAMEAAFSQIFEDGFFHGDPHPGNMLVTEDDKVVFLDWGLVGRISRAQQDQLIDLIITIISNDIDGITRLVLRMGVPESRVNMRMLRRDIQKIRDVYLTQELSKLDLTAMMEDIMALAHQHRIRVNPEFALLTKATATVEGILRRVYPDLDIIGTLRPIAERLIRERYDGEAIVRGGLVTLMSLNHLLRDLPLQLDQVLMDIESGELRIQVSNDALDAHTSSMTILGSRVFMGFLSAGLITGGSILISSYDWRPNDVPILAIVGAVFILSAAGFTFAAMSWHFVTGGIKKLRLAPWIRLFRRR